MGLFSRNVELGPPLRLSSWRKIAIGTWRSATDASVYGSLDFDAEPLLLFLERIREKSGERVTLSHLVGKAVADMLRQNPEINSTLRWGRIYTRKRVDVFFQVATDHGGVDLSGLVIRDADRKSVLEIAREMRAKVGEMRQGRDRAFEKTKNLMRILPGILVGPMLRLLSFILYDLNIHLPWLGTPRDAFGSVMITNIGTFGLEAAFAALVPFSRCPLVITVGAVDTSGVGSGTPQRNLRLCCTIDHRLIDGAEASRMARTLKEIFAAPERLWTLDP